MKLQEWCAKYGVAFAMTQEAHQRGQIAFAHNNEEEAKELFLLEDWKVQNVRVVHVSESYEVVYVLQKKPETTKQEYVYRTTLQFPQISLQKVVLYTPTIPTIHALQELLHEMYSKGEQWQGTSGHLPQRILEYVAALDAAINLHGDSLPALKENEITNYYFIGLNFLRVSVKKYTLFTAPTGCKFKVMEDQIEIEY